MSRKSTAKTIAKVAGVLAVLFLLITSVFIGTAFLHATFQLIMGWFIFIIHALPKIRFSLTMIVQALLLFGLSIVLIRSLWNWLATHRNARAISWQQSSHLTLLIVILFTSGTAATGLVQHVRWMSNERIIGSSMGKARRINCAGNLKQIGLALIIYAGDHGGYFPPNDDAAILNRENYLSLGRVYECPTKRKNRKPSNSADYVYRGGGLTDRDEHSTSTVIAHDKPGNHQENWINCLYLDGHVKGMRIPKGTNLDEIGTYGGIIFPPKSGPLPFRAPTAPESSTIQEAP